MRLPLYQTRVEWALAIFLALMAGYLDGYGLLVLGTYVSFMSGNTTTVGLRSGQGNFHAALPSAIAVLFFVTGSFLGTLFSQSRFRHSRQPCTGEKRRPYACVNASAGEMGIPWALCVRHRFPPRGCGKMASYSAQRASHERETHRFCADLRQRGVDHTHGQAE